MSWRLTMFTGAAALACAIVVFEFKGTVRTIDRQIAVTSRDIEQQQWRLQTLKADYAYLTRPERLAMQAAQLGMVPASTKEMTKVAGIALDSQAAFADKTVPVTLPGGETVELRFKPAAVAYASRDDGAQSHTGPEGASAPAAVPAANDPVAADDGGEATPPPRVGSEQVATATPAPAKTPAAASNAAQSAANRAAEAAKATKAAQAALAARIAQATARRSATMASQPSQPAPLWTRTPARQNNLP